ncbi:hypothetical protein K432DRAFT_304219, partial [Lepidopterella palustris CBS 459.81]
SPTVGSNNTMANHFCSTRGTLMYRIGSACRGMSILRIRTVDKFTLHETGVFCLSSRAGGVCVMIMCVFGRGGNTVYVVRALSSG